MRDIAILFLHLITIGVRLIRPGGARSIVAESLLLKHQLLIINRGRQRAPRLRPVDRVIAAISAAWMHPFRLLLRDCAEALDDHEFSPPPGEP